MTEGSKSDANAAAAPRSTLRARIHRAGAGLTHSVFVLVIALIFIRGGEPQATVKESLPPVSDSEPGVAALPGAPLITPLPEPYPKQEDGDESPEPVGADAAASPAEAFQLAQARRSRRQPREEPAPELATPLPTPQRSASDQARANRLMARLVAAYPDFLTGHDENNLIWRDGTRMGFDDGAEKAFQERLERADVEDQFAVPYPVGDVLSDPEPDSDPGRFRNSAFFTKMYGDCRRNEVQKRLVDMVWLPKNGAKKIKITSVNGVAEKLQRVSDELDALPPDLLKFVRPIAGTFNCRDIASTSRTSAHGYGIAIDVNGAFGDYWDWQKSRRGAPPPYEYRNRIPWEIAAIFEKHGFIWGAKWYHYDTFHFEYRPELLVEDAPDGPEAAIPMPVKQPRNLN